MQIDKLVYVDKTGIVETKMAEINAYCKTAIAYETDPQSEAETIKRCEGAQVVLVSWRTPISEAVIKALPDLKYIGMCCSLYDEQSANVAINAARERGIQVLGVRDYGDEGLAEFIIYSMISIFHGFGNHHWGEQQEELSSKTLGIIGFGTTGQMLAHRALAFGMQVNYYSRTRKPELEHDGITYMPLEKLLEASDVISTHLPKNTIVLEKHHFSLMKEKAILVNTSLEPTFDLLGFSEWILKPHHFAVLDRGGLGLHFNNLTQYENVFFTDKVSGFTHEATYRLSDKVLRNLETYLKNAFSPK